jgi:hypothetical protein
MWEAVRFVIDCQSMQVGWSRLGPTQGRAAALGTFGCVLRCDMCVQCWSRCGLSVNEGGEV